MIDANGASSLQRVRSVAELRAETNIWKTNGAKIGFVPTMGALHAGHLDLVKRAKRLADKVVVSIFVNPLQFAPSEDLDRYPRDEAGDVAKLEAAGCDLVYLPTVDALYPRGFVSRIEMSGPALGLETDFRPQFFSGVATVVMKLFNQVGADLAVFGEKDFQQLAVVRVMARDFDLGLDIIGAPTTREADGLALSSRNAYLSPPERAVAPELHRQLQLIAASPDPDAAIEDAKAALTKLGFGKIDYISLRDADTLGLVSESTTAKRLLAALWLGKTRLIDNISA